MSFLGKEIKSGDIIRNVRRNELIIFLNNIDNVRISNFKSGITESILSRCKISLVDDDEYMYNMPLMLLLYGLE